MSTVSYHEIKEGTTTTTVNPKDGNHGFDVTMSVLDYGVVALYFGLVLAAGLYSMRRTNRGTISGYFLAGRFMFWLPVGASVFASNIGSDHFIGLAGSGAAAGISVGAFELNALLILQLTGWIFLPVFIASKVSTLPEFMSKRFGGQRIRTYLALLSLLLYIFTKISVNLYSGAIYVQQALQWNIYVAVIILLAMTAICTVTGGLAAVIYTDTLQFFVMIVGATLVAIKAYMKVGGLESLREQYMQAVPSKLIPNSTCGIPTEHSWQLLRPYNDDEMPWPGFLLGQTPASIWYWCTDQMMVQRLLAAKSLSHAQGATLFAGFMKITPLFLIVIPGMISRVLFTDTVGCVDPDDCFKYCQNKAGCSNIAYPRLVLELMPSGMRGLMLAVMLAALMSDLTSVFNSASTLFTMDIWPQLRKKTTLRELMIVGRTFVIFMVIVSILWIPVIQQMQGGQLFIYIQAISAYLAPPIAAVYIMAVFWKRMNEQGAFWGLMAGFAVGVVRMILDFTYPVPPCYEEDTRPEIISKVHYMYFAMILFWSTALSSFVVSLMTTAPEPFRLIRTTYWTRFISDERLDDTENMEFKNSEKVKLPNGVDSGDELSDRDAKEFKAKNEGTSEQKPAEKGPLRKCWSWFCGFDQIPKTEQEQTEYSERLANVGSLEQTKMEKGFLLLGLLCVVSTGVFLMVYFSVY